MLGSTHTLIQRQVIIFLLQHLVDNVAHTFATICTAAKIRKINNKLTRFILKLHSFSSHISLHHKLVLLLYCNVYARVTKVKWMLKNWAVPLTKEHV
jgi:hypothetical protein